MYMMIYYNTTFFFRVCVRTCYKESQPSLLQVFYVILHQRYKQSYTSFYKNVRILVQTH